jgi:hypothetical protein
MPPTKPPRPFPDCPLVIACGLGVDSNAMLIEFSHRGIRPDLIQQCPKTRNSNDAAVPGSKSRRPPGCRSIVLVARMHQQTERNAQAKLTLVKDLGRSYSWTSYVRQRVELPLFPPSAVLNVSCRISWSLSSPASPIALDPFAKPQLRHGVLAVFPNEETPWPEICWKCTDCASSWLMMTRTQGIAWPFCSV